MERGRKRERERQRGGGGGGGGTRAGKNKQEKVTIELSRDEIYIQQSKHGMYGQGLSTRKDESKL